MVRLRAHSYGLLGTPSTQAGEPHFLLLVKRAEEPQQGRPEDDGRLLHGGKTLAQNVSPNLPSGHGYPRCSQIATPWRLVA